jgi:outer membrane lipoprotein SlyB
MTTSPIVKIAAGAFIIVCGVAAATMTGLIPSVSSQSEAVESEQVKNTNKEAANAAVTPVSTPRPIRRAAAPKPAAPVKIACNDCGVIESINAIERKGESNGTGAVVGGLAGLVVGNQIGHSKKSRTITRVLGAAAGAAGGNQVEKNARKKTEYEIVVRMEDGSTRTITQASDDGLLVGSRVKLNGDVIALN